MGATLPYEQNSNPPELRKLLERSAAILRACDRLLWPRTVYVRKQLPRGQGMYLLQNAMESF